MSGVGTTLRSDGPRPSAPVTTWPADYTFTELDAGHWLPETHPREVAAAILERRRTLPQ